jgi:hypothetical protein
MALERVARLLGDFASKYGRMGTKAANAGVKIADRHSEIVDAIKLMNLELEASEPQVITIDAPVRGFGVEIGYNFVVSKYYVEGRW